MQIALVSGASSGIGYAIVQKLLKLNYKVYGIGRDFKNKIEHINFIPIVLDLNNINDIISITDTIDDKISLLINSAGFGIFKELEYFKSDEISSMIDINLKAPLILTNLFINDLKNNSGHIINISSIESTKHSRLSTIYTSTKAALRAFSLTLFEEARKNGIRVSNINPDITDTPFFDKLSFKPTNDKTTHLLASQIANSVEFIIKDRDMIITDITIRAQKFKLQKIKRTK